MGCKLTNLGSEIGNKKGSKFFRKQIFLGEIFMKEKILLEGKNFGEGIRAEILF